MVKISRTDKGFTRLQTKSLAEAGIKERYLQKYIFNSRDDFCKELGQEASCFLKIAIAALKVDAIAH
jgi:hypothetical protein